MKKLHLVCNAHIDPIWQWEWEEGASTVLSTFQSASNLLKKHDYLFCHNEANLYMYTERFAPELFENIKKDVKDGKWNIMGGWFLQPDCLMPTGEALLRQIQIGKEYFLEKFGTYPKTAINFDPFGHSRGLVQILKKCGQENYLFMRPYGPHVREIPQLVLPSETFKWVGYDGSTVKTYRISEYSSQLGHAIDKLEADIRKREKEEISMCTWGVGNHGGGPSDKDLTEVNEYIKKRKDIEIVHSTPDKFFDEVDPKEEFDKSLLQCMPGCYTSMANLKTKYRELEKQLFYTEKLTTSAYLKNCLKEYPINVFHDATLDMLNVQFHDILPGDMIKAGEENGLTYINHALHMLNQTRADAVFALIKGEKPAKEGEYPIFAFNPKPYAYDALIECDFSIIPTDYWDTETSYIDVYDENGVKLLSQTIKESSNVAIDWRKKVIFKGRLEPMTYTRFTAKTRPDKVIKHALNEEINFDNGLMQVHISKDTGLIDSYKIDGKEYALGNLFELEEFKDYEDPWGMNYTYVGWEPTAFELLKNPDGVFTGMNSIQVIEDGDIYLGVEAFFKKGLTRARIGYKLYKDSTRVDIDIDMYPNEINKCYKVRIPLNGEKPFGEEVFGREELFTNGMENVSQNYIGLESDDKNVVIVTPTTYGSSYKDGILDITMLRTATYCAHPVGDRNFVKPNIYIPKVDMGERSFHFTLDIMDKKDIKMKTMEIIEKPYALNIFPTIDKAENDGTRIELDNSRIHLVTMKKSERTEGIVIRLENQSEISEKAKFSIGDSSIDLDFTKFEVKTIIYKNGEFTISPEMYI